ncbi:MAG: hypothetical protein MUF34_24150 [Polyangiaceae bacterium]|jgi:hypothetical protein|nr:hypothetical protein [Polyangiaceae bacterium]
MRLDLHRHLEGSHSPRALLEVARAFDLRAGPFFDEARQVFRSVAELTPEITLSTPSDDASHFYRCIVRARAAYANVEAVGALAQLAFREAAEETDGFEMRVSLFSMARTVIENQRLAWRDVPPTAFAEDWARPLLIAILAARDAVVAEAGKPILLRLGLSRTFESEAHYRALAAMAIEHAPALVGLDVLGIVAGADQEPMPAALLDILDGLRAHLPDLTVHAGEFEGHASVERTLALSPRAIGHGVRSLESPATLERLAREGVTLEVCPSSNRLLIPTALAALEHAHRRTPLAALQRASVHCVLGSDDPTPLRTSYRRERELAAELGVNLARLDADTRRRWHQLAPEATL